MLHTRTHTHTERVHKHTEKHERGREREREEKDKVQKSKTIEKKNINHKVVMSSRSMQEMLKTQKKFEQDQRC